MPVTTTLATLLSEIAEETDLGLVIAAGTGATTSITETDTGVSELRGPFTGAKIPIGSPVTVITGGTVGEDSYVSNFVSSTGVVTLSPAITTAATGFIIWKPEVKHGKNVEKAISRAHQKCRRWMKVPLTYVPDGEMLAATVTDFWTASAGTASYQSLASPELGGRVLQLSHSTTANVQSNTIPVRPRETWQFETAIRTTTSIISALDFADIVVVDVTNSTTITPTFSATDNANGSPGTAEGRAFETQKGTFTVPATCTRIAFRLAISGNNATITAQMAPIIASPVDARSFPFTNRVLGPERIGNYFYSSGGYGPDERNYSDPLLTSGAEVTYSHNGDHIVATFNFAPTRPVYYDELIYGGALTAMTDTTLFPADMVKLWARAEIYDFLMRGEMVAQKRMDNGTPLPSTWRQLRNAAYKSAKWSQWEPEMVNLVGRR